MSKQKNKNSLLSGHARTTPASLAREELLAMKFVMDKPPLPIYPLGDKLPQTYPDFFPWDEPDLKNDKLNNSNYLNKGYFENPLVSNEYYSARNLIQETLFSSSSNCTKLLNELSLNLTNSFRTRNHDINRISHSSSTFKLPPRVTLTALKREAWLKDLANADIPLLRLCTKIPHGIRNKVLLECMCNLNVPISRAIWFTKCVLYSEQLLMKKKLQLKVSPAKLSTAIEIMESRWSLEWTLHVADYLLKFSREMDSISTVEQKNHFMQKLNYLLLLIKTLYVECLVDKTTFLSAVINFLREDQPFLLDDLPLLLELSRTDSEENDTSVEMLISKLAPLNYGQTLFGLTFIKIFWADILKEYFLCKSTNEALLLNFFLIEKISAEDLQNSHRVKENPIGVPLDLKQNILRLISTSITSMFKHNSNVFIVPDFWILIGEVLFRILMSDKSLSDQRENIESTLKLISYRNESLMLNMKYSFKGKNSLSMTHGVKALRKNSFLLPALQSGRLQNLAHQPVESDFTCFSDSKEDILCFINCLDRNKLNRFLTDSLMPKRPSEKGYNHWKVRLKAAIYWCVTVFRDLDSLSVRILTFCNFLERRVLHQVKGRGSSLLKAELENEILESIFSIPCENSGPIHMRNLYILINELYQLKVITISAYLRKIIACGIFYVSPEAPQELERYLNDSLISFHISILQNLPVLNNKQCDHILKKWTTGGSNFTANFNRGTELVQKHVLDGITNNNFGSNYNSFLAEIDKLEMGVKFLVVNWLTSQIKTTISKSPKLIHLSPLTIANIYRFYETTDNLAVFFKILVKFILKNEDKVIIFYLETLYYICKLLVSHFSLIKLIAGQTYESSSAASELFKLVLLCYKDILSRETDMYRFQEIWAFISKSTEKQPSTRWKLPGDSGLRGLLFNKETAESPLSIQTPASRRKDFYSPEEFHADLESFLTGKTAFLTELEIQDCFSEILLSLEIMVAMADTLNDPENAILHLLNAWFSQTSHDENKDLSFYKLIEQNRKRVKLSMGAEFYSAISSFVQTRPDQNCNLKKVATFIRKLLSFELFLIMDLLTMVGDFASKNHQDFWKSLVSDLLFRKQDKTSISSQALMYDVLLSEYKSSHMQHLLGYAIVDLKELNDNDLSQAEQQLHAVMNNLILNPRVSLEMLMRELSTSTLLLVCNHLARESKPVTDILQLGNAVQLPNEFCLPVWQLMLNVLTTKKQLSKEELGSTALQIISRSKFLFGLNNSFFGELFDLLNWESRLNLFYYFEISFFEHCHFIPEEDAMESNNRQLVLLRLPSSPLGMLSIIKDLFKKFSCPLVDKIETLQLFLRHISQFASKLVTFLGLEYVKGLDDESIYNTVSIFLRLLIIHNSSLADQVGRSDYIELEFFQNLVALFNSEYLSNGHEKLHILLYDLLLMMKSSLTQILSVIPNESLLETLPETSLNGSDMEHRRSYDRAAASTIMTILGSLNFPEPSTGIVTLPKYLEDDCIVTLDDDELNYTGDICVVNNKKLEMASSMREPLHITSPFDVPKENPKKIFSMKSVALIENPTPGINNGCFNLALFDAYTTEENPL